MCNHVNWKLDRHYHFCPDCSENILSSPSPVPPPELTPIRFTIDPNGIACLFLANHAPDSGSVAVEDLIDLFKMFYEKGREDASNREL